jgi:hypothetical protein
LLERIATPRNVHFTTAWDQIRGGVGRRRWHRISQCDQEWKLKKVMANVVTKQMTTKMQSKYRVAKELRRSEGRNPYLRVFGDNGHVEYVVLGRANGTRVAGAVINDT